MGAAPTSAKGLKNKRHGVYFRKHDSCCHLARISGHEKSDWGAENFRRRYCICEIIFEVSESRENSTKTYTRINTELDLQPWLTTYNKTWLTFVANLGGDIRGGYYTLELTVLHTQLGLPLCNSPVVFQFPQTFEIGLHLWPSAERFLVQGRRSCRSWDSGCCFLGIVHRERTVQDRRPKVEKL